MIISGADMKCNPFGTKALAAREWFAENGPADLQPLPLGYAERERLKNGTITHIVAWYARSLAEQSYDVRKHPSFYDYSCGVMASPHLFEDMARDPVLRKRFPPRPLDGLDAHFYWAPP